MHFPSLLGMIYLIFLICCPWSTEALIPKVCLKNITYLNPDSSVCCPVSKITGTVCGGTVRGSCENAAYPDEPIPIERRREDRVHWPSKWFTKTCKCKGNYFGLACDECWFGWTGKQCEKREYHVRRNVLSFTPRERNQFIRVLDKTTRVRTDYVILNEEDRTTVDPLRKPQFIETDLRYLLNYVHHYAARTTLLDNKTECEAGEQINLNHETPGFHTWHRYFMLIWERELRKIAIAMFGWHEFAMPYWDWIDATSCEVCDNSLFGKSGELVDGRELLDKGSIFYNWREVCPVKNPNGTCLSCHDNSDIVRGLSRPFVSHAHPTSRDLQYVLSKKIFFAPNKGTEDYNCDNFNWASEGFCGDPVNDELSNWHNKLHLMIDGTFWPTPSSPGDPIFTVHHIQVDRIFQHWFVQNNQRVTDYPETYKVFGNCRDCNMVALFPLVTHADMFCDIENLGVIYDNYNFGLGQQEQQYRGNKAQLDDHYAHAIQ